MTSGSRKLVKFWLLITNVPSRPSTRAHHVPSLFLAPTLSLCNDLLSGELVNSIASCGFSKPCCGVVAPSQRTARKPDKVLSNDCRFV